MSIRSSFSQHNMFQQCARQWFYAKILGIQKLGDMSYANGGNAIHRTLEQYYTNQITETEKLKEFFNKIWSSYNLESSIISGKKDEYWLMILNGIELNTKATSCEFKIFYPEVLAYIDYIDTINDEIKDWKSSTRSSENEHEYLIQGNLYGWLYFRHFNRIPKKITFHYLKYRGSKQLLEIIPTMEDIEKVKTWYYNILQQMEKVKNNNVLPPRCSQCNNWCPFKEECFTPDEKIFTINILGHYLKIDGITDDVIHKQLEKKFSYEKKDSYFIKQKVIRKMNAFGKHINPDDINTRVCFWNKRQQLLPFGFLDDVQKTLNDYLEWKKIKGKIVIKDHRKINNKVVDIVPNNYTLRDYQQEAVNKFLEKKYGIIAHATGGGKTIIALDIISKLKVKTLFVVEKIELLNQTVKKIKDTLNYDCGVIGKGENNIKDITVATIQSLISKKDSLQEYFNSVRLVVMDECLHKSTKIRLSDGTEKSIEEIYNDNKITEVLSYNEEKRIFESKKILRKIKLPQDVNFYEIILEDELGSKHKIRATDNHKIWTEDGYKQVKELIDNDVLKVYLEPIKYKCKICNTIYNKLGHQQLCIKKHKYGTDIQKKCSLKARDVLKEKRKDKEYNEQFLKKLREGFKKRDNNIIWKEKMKQMGLKRLGKNNKIFTYSNSIEKMKNSIKKTFHSKPIEEQKEQIIRFNSSYRKMPFTTKPEQMIVDMNINNLEYNIDRKYMYKFSDKKWKIPDFKVKDENKVIEVSDFEHWRKPEYKDIIINKFKEIGIDCLYLDEKELKNNYNETKQKIEKFCYNHKAKIISIKKCEKRKNQFKYNLEIEDNHNYIANKILVSNCHHVPSNSYWKLSHYLNNVEYKLLLSATPQRDDGNTMYINAIGGNIVHYISTQDLINRGYLTKPQIYFINNTLTATEKNIMDFASTDGKINETENYLEFYKNFIVLNMNRNLLCKNIVDKFKQNKKILILVKLIEHGEILSELLQCPYLKGSTKKEDRESLIKDFSEGQLNVMVGTISIFSEGLDFPKLDILINMCANSGEVKTIQILGRILRILEGKDTCMYFDFMDNSQKFFLFSSSKRQRTFKKQKHKIKYLNTDEINNLS
jgi:superfamily II DNA or RNA helicase